MKVKELKGVLRESVYILNVDKKEELFIPTQSGETHIGVKNDEILWEKYGESIVEEIFNENESIMIKIKK
ncbi:hypothetical protein AB2T14_001150 [Clostridium botulinum]